MRRLVATAAVAAAIAGCRQQPVEITPPAIHYGQDACAACSMIISDDRFAGAIGVRDGGRISYMLFDDVGEMLQFMPGGHDEIRWFATDAVTRIWLDAGQAVFLRSDRLMTPMGTGVGAYATRDAAMKSQQEHGGSVLGFGDLRTAN